MAVAGADMFYNVMLFGLLVLTVLLAWAARPSTSDTFPAGFTSFMFRLSASSGLHVSFSGARGPNMGRCSLSLGRSRPVSGEFGQDCGEFEQFCPSVAKCGASSANFTRMGPALERGPPTPRGLSRGQILD